MAGSLLILVQCAIEPSTENIACSIITVVAAALTFGYCLRPAMLQRHPLSALAVMGYNVTSMTLALVAQTLYLNPVTFNLQQPLVTFGTSAVLQLVLLAAHATYSSVGPVQRLRHLASSRLLVPLGLFRRPGVTELWFLGFFGLAAIWYARIINVGDIEYGDAGGRFLQALRPFAAAPFLIPLRGAFSGTRVSPPGVVTVAMLGAYFLAIVATAITANARSIFATVVLIFLLASMLMMGMGRLTFTGRTKFAVLLGLLLAVPVLSIASDLANAMVIARKSRGEVNLSGMVTATADAFNDKEELAASLNRKIVMSGSTYSEYYLSNPFVQRLTFTKYTDLLADASSRFGDSQIATLREDAHQQLISILPTPVLNIIGVDLDKSVTAHSTGDVYNNLAFGTTDASFRTGSSIINSKDVLGPWWIPGMFGVFLLGCWTVDLLSLRTRAGLALSPLSFIMLFVFFTREFLTDSFSGLIAITTRGVIQNILIYAVLLLVARSISILVRPARHSTRRPFG